MVSVFAIPTDALEGLLEACHAGRVRRESLADLLRALARGETNPMETLPEPLTEAEVDGLVKGLVAETNGCDFRDGGARQRHLMGRAMRTARGRTDAAALSRRFARTTGGEA